MHIVNYFGSKVAIYFNEKLVVHVINYVPIKERFIMHIVNYFSTEFIVDLIDEFRFLFSIEKPGRRSIPSNIYE